jgi:hypothetical protein
MFDYTSAANKQDRYLRDGGPAISSHAMRMQDDPIYAHHYNESLISAAAAEMDAKQREINRDAFYAARAENERLAEVEGRILHPRQKNSINIHD